MIIVASSQGHIIATLQQMSYAKAYKENSSCIRRRYCFRGLNVLKRGSLMTSGQIAGQGDPQILLITSRSCASLGAWNIGFFVKSSPRMQLFKKPNI